MRAGWIFMDVGVEVSGLDRWMGCLDGSVGLKCDFGWCRDLGLTLPIVFRDGKFLAILVRD